MKKVFCALWLLLLATASFGQQLPHVEQLSLQEPPVYDASTDPDPEPDYRWQDSHEKERNIAFAASAASVICAVYSGTRALEARSRAEDKYDEYKSLWYGTTQEEFDRVKSEYSEYRDDGNLFAVTAATLGALAVVGMGFAIYWSF